ncbi:MAG: DUF86 domain-containing protein [Chloroflexi bacterium]|nr:DUF86 domain-containing protein [Chloroflexota bacterium]
MSRDFRLLLDDILSAAHKVQSYTVGMNFDQFRNDAKTFDAVVRNLEIIGDAVKHISQDMRDRHTHIEWRRIAGLRDITVHEYFGVDENIIWDVVQNEIPKLILQIELILDEDDASE